MMVASWPLGETLASPEVPGIGSHRLVKTVGMMVIVRLVGMAVAKGCWVR